MRKPFEGIFGNTAELRLLEFLLPLEGLSFNLSELAEEAGVSRPTSQKVVEKFVEHGIMKIAKKEGITKFYEINKSSPFVFFFEEINNSLIEEMLSEDTLIEIRRYWESKAPKPEAFESETIDSKPEIAKVEMDWPKPTPDFVEERPSPTLIFMNNTHGGITNAA